MSGMDFFSWSYTVIGMLGLAVVAVTAFGSDGPDTSPTFLKRTAITWLAFLTLFIGVRVLSS